MEAKTTPAGIPANNTMVDIEMIAEDAKHVERAALKDGQTVDEFIVNALAEACAGKSVVTVGAEDVGEKPLE